MKLNKANVGRTAFIVLQMSIFVICAFHIIEDVRPLVISFYLSPLVLHVVAIISAATALVFIHDAAFFHPRNHRLFFRTFTLLLFLVTIIKLRNNGIGESIFFACIAFIAGIFTYKSLISHDEHSTV